PPESRILMFAMTEGAIRFLADTAQLFATAARDGVAADDEAVTARIAASFTGSLIMRPLMLYLLAAVAGGIARRAGGTGSWRDSRAAVCWAALVAAPIFVATSTVQTAVVLPALAQEAVWMINVSSFAVALAYCLAEAHGFRRVWAVFLVIGVSTILLVAGALALSRL
ncbi:MAG: YIP1 family protein, partial [Pseudomonadota bacterium]